jgi:tRNA pseudouridine38-40 synthase
VPNFGVLLTVAYDGKTFSGFARQTNARTIAGELDGAIAVIDPKATPVRGASRTDAGVHARGQRVAFDSDKSLLPRNWALAIGAQLPTEIAITRAAVVAPGYDPRRHALHKRYRYLVLESPVRDPFLEGRAWRVPYRLNHVLMQEEAHALVGEHDFAAFRGAQDERTETVRRMFRARVRAAVDSRCIEIVVEGDRFLYRMMRIIAGTLVDVGSGRLEPNAVKRALDTRHREDLGVTAPAEGLYLEHMELDDEGAEGWP